MNSVTILLQRLEPKKAFVAPLLAVLAASACAVTPTARSQAVQQPPPSDLVTMMRGLDSMLFTAFNRCKDPEELKRHAALFAPDVEFYHDNGGVTWTRDAMVENTRKHACGNYTRALVDDSFEAFRIAGFGALTRGTHKFCRVDTGACEGKADFVFMWKEQAGEWHVTRAYSFNHRPAE